MERWKKKTPTKVSTKSYGMVNPYAQRALHPLFCLKKTLSIIIVISRKYCLLLYDTETVNLEITEPSNKTTEHEILTKKGKSGVPNIFHHILTRIHGQQIVPIRILWITSFGTNSLRPSTGIT